MYYEMVNEYGSKKSVETISNAKFSKLAAGPYTVRATSNYCKSADLTVTLAIYNPVTVNVTSVRHACFGNFSGGMHLSLYFKLFNYFTKQ